MCVRVAKKISSSSAARGRVGMNANGVPSRDIENRRLLIYEGASQ